MSLIESAAVSSPFMGLTVRVVEGVVVSASFARSPRPQRDGFGVYDLLVAYFEGEVDALDEIETHADGTPFQLKVWEALRTIPAGETATYGEIAAQVGEPGAARAVGMANAANPIPLIVPCHRVVRAGGKLGGYGGGLPLKRALLDHEYRYSIGTRGMTLAPTRSKISSRL
jgi:methylated-DNA-[protein]-cysteine S-methyltransferase